MSELQRYKCHINEYFDSEKDENMYKSDNGGWCKYEDVQAEIERLKSEVVGKDKRLDWQAENLTNMVDKFTAEYKAEIERLQKKIDAIAELTDRNHVDYCYKNCKCEDHDIRWCSYCEFRAMGMENISSDIDKIIEEK